MSYYSQNKLKFNEHGNIQFDDQSNRTVHHKPIENHPDFVWSAFEFDEIELNDNGTKFKLKSFRIMINTKTGRVNGSKLVSMSGKKFNNWTRKTQTKAIVKTMIAAGISLKIFAYAISRKRLIYPTILIIQEFKTQLVSLITHCQMLSKESI